MSTTALSATSAKLNGLLDTLLDAFFKNSPEAGAFLDWPRYRDEIFDLTKQDEYLATCAHTAAELDLLDKSTLTEDEQNLIIMVKSFIKKETLEARTISRKDMPATHMQGTIVGSWMQLVHASAVKTVKDIENFRSRLEKIAPRMDQVIDGFRKGIESKYTLPIRSIDLLIKGCDGYITEDPATNPWNIVKDVTAVGLPEDFLHDAIRTSVVPAHKKLKTFLQDEYRQHARKYDGIYGMPGSEEAYQDFIRIHTDSDVTADELHQLGLKEVARIATEMEATIAKLGFQGSIKDFINALNDKTQYPHLYIDNVDDIIPAYESLLKIIDAKMPAFFGKFPKDKCAIVAVPAHSEAGAPEAMYFPGTKEKPGKFLVNLSLAKGVPTHGMRALLLHEANPGHHHQMSLALERDTDHDIRKLIFSTAQVEGWGLYSESLGVELGMYEDPLDWFGRLELEMHRALRLVVDTGLHHLGWSVDKVKDSMRPYVSLSESTLENEAIRYACMPGQALAYKYGEIKIQAMRATAAKRLGDKFDLRAFHDVLMGLGTAPLDYFETVVGKWVDAQLSE